MFCIFRFMLRQTRMVVVGLKTGLVVDSGAAATHIVPVSDGHSDPHQIKRLCIAGDHVTQRLSELLLAHGYCITAGHSAALRVLKERCCYVAASYSQELEVRTCTIRILFQYPCYCITLPQEFLFTYTVVGSIHTSGSCSCCAQHLNGCLHMCS